MHASTLCRKEFTLIVSEGSLRWKRPKFHGKKVRYLQASIPLPDARLLQRCLTAGSLPDTERALRYRLAAVGKRAGYEGLTPLTLRHSRAVYLLDEGMSVNRVASLLGCSWAVLEKHYAQIEAERLIMPEKPLKPKPPSDKERRLNLSKWREAERLL
jgi:hypothetical protein